MDSSTQITTTSPAQFAGVVPVIVASPYGNSTPTLLTQFTYLAAVPTVTSIDTNTGTTAGGTTVNISGSDFTGATQVTFGGVQSAFVVNDDGSITATSPIQTTGTFDILIVNPWGSSSAVSADEFTYTAATDLPTVTSLSVSSGPTGGGTAVTITGTHFDTTSSVTFGSMTAVSWVVNSATSLTVVSPYQAASTVDIS